MVNVWSMTKKSFCVKNIFFAKNALFCKIIYQSKDFFWLIQAPNISKHISRKKMEKLQLRLLEKQLKTKFFILRQKGNFCTKNGSTIQKSYSPKYVYSAVYIGTNVLVYERWLVLKVWYTVKLLPFHTHIAYACESMFENVT